MSNLDIIDKQLEIQAWQRLLKYLSRAASLTPDLGMDEETFLSWAGAAWNYWNAERMLKEEQALEETKQNLSRNGKNVE